MAFPSNPLFSAQATDPSSNQTPASKVCVIILNWNRWADTLECLESVVQSQYSNFQVVICDNDSHDGSMGFFQAWAEGNLDVWRPQHPLRKLSFPPVSKPLKAVCYQASDIQEGTIVNDLESLVFIQIPQNLGYAGGNNVGMRYAMLRNDFDFIWILNNDTVVAPDALAELVKGASRQPRMGLFGGQVLYYDAPHTIQSIGGHMVPWLGKERFLGGMESEHISDMADRPVGHLLGASLLIRSAALKDVGLFDESYFMYREETDWCLRAKQKAWECFYCSQAKIWHKESVSITKKSSFQDYYLVRNLLFLIRRFYPLSLPTAFLSIAFRTLLPKLIRWQPDRLKAVLRAYWDFLKGQTGPLQLGAPLSQSSVKKVLIYRFGSLGDTLIALPCFHIIRRHFPNAECRLLTNFPVHSKAPAAQLILENTGLIDGYVEYPPGMRDVKKFLALRSQIQQWQPDVCVYITESHQFLKAWRDYWFFRFCGIPQVLGLPHSQSLRTNQWLKEKKRYESETQRLLRCLASLERVDENDVAYWELNLTDAEKQKAQTLLTPLASVDYLICSVGTKMPANDWGEDNWKALIQQMADAYAHHGLIFIGGKEDHERSEKLKQFWKGPTLNTCGLLKPRESAALIKNGKLFIGHDSGPMHVAATMGVRCLGIFSARIKPGVWFPHGKGNRVIYHKTECYDCGLQTCVDHQKKCIMSITVEEVLQTVHTMLPLP